MRRSTIGLSMGMRPANCLDLCTLHILYTVVLINNNLSVSSKLTTYSTNYVSILRLSYICLHTTELDGGSIVDNLLYAECNICIMFFNIFALNNVRHDDCF